MKYFAPLFILLIGLSSCKKDPEVTFDTKLMLENLADEIILPEYESMESNLTVLQAKTTAFNADVNTTTLDELKTAYLTTCKNFERVKMFNFGPAGDFGIKAAMNTYPTDSEKINNNISAGSYSLGTAANIDAIGLPAMDYLLFAGGETAVLDRFTTDENSTVAKQYLQDVTDKMVNEFKPVNDKWKSSYRTTFVAATGTDVGSSISLLFNEFVQDIELVKNAKIGIPAGQFSGGMILPEQVQALYSGYSKILAIESTIALKNVFVGKKGLSFDDYMTFVEQEKDIPVDALTVSAQFDACRVAIETLSDPFSDGIPVDATSYLETFQQFKKLTAYIKVDVASTLGILITFSDTDGD